MKIVCNLVYLILNKKFKKITHQDRLIICMMNIIKIESQVFIFLKIVLKIYIAGEVFPVIDFTI